MNDFDYEERTSSEQRDNFRNEPKNMENRDLGNRDLGALKRLDSIQDPGFRYMLKDRIGAGVYGDVYEGIDQQAGKQQCIN